MSFWMEIEHEKAGNQRIEREKTSVIKGKFPHTVQTFQMRTEKKAKNPTHYFVMECAQLYQVGKICFDPLSKTLCKGLQTMLSKHHISNKASILVVGVGNNGFAADALGPRTVQKVLATAAFDAQKIEKLGLRKVFAFNPDVCQKTGLPTAKSVRAFQHECGAECVILVDSFSSKEPMRLGKSFQLFSAGLSPGGGVDNLMPPISRELLKVPVFSLGVPMVSFGDILFRPEESSDFVFTPKNIEQMVEYCSIILSQAINLSLHASLNKEEIGFLMF